MADTPLDDLVYGLLASVDSARERVVRHNAERLLGLHAMVEPIRFACDGDVTPLTITRAELVEGWCLNLGVLSVEFDGVIELDADGTFALDLRAWKRWVRLGREKLRIDVYPSEPATAEVYVNGVPLKSFGTSGD